MTRTPVRWVLAVSGGLIVLMWILTTVRSQFTMPWNNEWLVMLVLLAIVAFVGLPHYTLPLPQGASRARDADGELIEKPEYPYPLLRTLSTFIALFLGLTWLLMAPIPSSEGARGSAVVERDGRDVAYVAYDRYGPQGMLQIALRNFFPQNVVAIDVETGQHLWATRIAEDNFLDARVVAANEEYVYVAYGAGLRVLDAETGRTIVTPEDFAGLDEGSIGVGRFVHDRATDRILAQTSNGLAQISVGELAATRATEEDGYTWTPLFGDEYHDLVATFPTADEAAAGDALIEIDDDGITVRRADEAAELLTDHRFEGGDLVIDPVPPVRATQQFRAVGVDPHPLIPADTSDAIGAAGGYVVVSESSYSDRTRTRLTTVSLETGESLDSIVVDEIPTGGATSATGSSVITLRERFIGTSPVVLISPRGALSTSMVGRADFFGTAL
ncbi:PA2928 family protein [Leucobacter sp. gxy201]|uniref:PA2928 family protein n=1 Tax=Leucobacter sp. gxy201 TaxID=2957200 RepID=UPI003DA08CD4